MLQKPLKPGRRFSRLKPTQAKVATKSDSGPITEVTDELSARSCDAPHPYTKNAPTAQKFSDQRCKWSFATVSGHSRHGCTCCWPDPIAIDPSRTLTSPKSGHCLKPGLRSRSRDKVATNHRTLFKTVWSLRKKYAW